MLIDGPFKVSVLEKDFGMGRELHLTFKPEFRDLPLAGREAEFRDYVDR